MSERASGEQSAPPPTCAVCGTALPEPYDRDALCHGKTGSLVAHQTWREPAPTPEPSAPRCEACGHAEARHTDDGVCLDCREAAPDDWFYAHTFDPKPATPTPSRWEMPDTPGLNATAASEPPRESGAVSDARDELLRRLQEYECDDRETAHDELLAGFEAAVRAEAEVEGFNRAVENERLRAAEWIAECAALESALREMVDEEWGWVVGSDDEAIPRKPEHHCGYEHGAPSCRTCDGVWFKVVTALDRRALNGQGEGQ